MMRMLRLLAVSLSLACLAGCNTDTALTPAEIVVDPSVTVTGLPVNADFDTTIMVRNLGGEDLSIVSVAVLHQSLVQVLLETPATVIGGDSLAITVRLHAPSSGRFTDTITVETSDAQFPSVAISIVLTTATYETAQSGWTLFESGNFSDAAIAFADAVTLDGAYGDALLGLGWSRLKLDQLSLAVAAFNLAITQGFPNDAHAGRALAQLNAQNYALAVQDVDAVVTIAGTTSNTYTFPHNNTITEKDLLWVKARAHFLLGEYASAQTVVNVLAPSNTLDPQSPTYTADLAALIESLRTTV